jgi:hypothetical protein
VTGGGVWSACRTRGESGPAGLGGVACVLFEVREPVESRGRVLHLQWFTLKRGCPVGVVLCTGMAGELNGWRFKSRHTHLPASRMCFHWLQHYEEQP